MSVAEPLTFAAALGRLEREARQGEFAASRYRCRFVEWGQGPALVFVNGVGDEPRSFALPMALLAPHFRCIAYRLPTGGDDGARLRGYRHDHLLEDLGGLLDHLNVEQATLLGHSFGATVALRALHQEPGRFPRGVLMNGFAFRPLTRQHWWLGLLGSLLPARVRLKSLRDLGLRLGQAHRGPFERHEPQRWAKFLELTGEAPARSMAHFGNMLNGLDLRPLLPQIKQPTLVMSGDADPLVSAARQETLFNGLPNAVMFQLHGCGHLPMWTHPEAVAGALLTFHGLLPPPGAAHECGQGPDAAGNCPTTGQACFGKEVGREGGAADAAGAEAPAAKA